MDPMIRKLILKRFRSIPSEEVAFDNPTILVGRNGSGKSNFVDAFAFLAEAMVSPLQAVLDRRGGIGAVRNRTSGQSYPPNVGFAVEFGPLNGEVLKNGPGKLTAASSSSSAREVFRALGIRGASTVATWAALLAPA